MCFTLSTVRLSILVLLPFIIKSFECTSRIGSHVTIHVRKYCSLLAHCDDHGQLTMSSPWWLYIMTNHRIAFRWQPQYSSQAVIRSRVLMKIHHGELIVSSLWPSWWASHERVRFVQPNLDACMYSLWWCWYLTQSNSVCLISIFSQKVLILFINNVHHECNIFYESGSVQYNECFINTVDADGLVLLAPGHQ